MEKTHIKSIRILFGEQIFVYELGMIVNGMKIAKIVTISNNVEKANVVYGQTDDGRTVFQANSVVYLAEHEK